MLGMIYISRKLSCRLGFGAMALAGFASAANAQLNMTSRLSIQHFVYVHGGGPDVHTADVTNTANDLLSADAMQTTAFDSTAGEWFTHTWATSVFVDDYQDYSIDGPLDAATRISSSMYTNLWTTGTGDIPTAGIQTTNPGNDIEFHFTVDHTQDYQLSGSIFGGSSAFSYVALQRFNGFNWESLFLSFANPGPDITWDTTGSLFAGYDYRLIGTLDDAVGMNESHGKNLSYQFSVVPEPTTFAVIGLGLVALRRRAKR